ncbi:reverse transcriptase domain-containing protein, partial [Tanacetum coccineum]
DCKAGPRMVNPLNAKNPIAARRACCECGGTDHYKSACPSGMWKSIRDRSRGSSPRPKHCDGFVSTTFVPLLDIEPSSLGFSYEIEIASGQLVEINKVIHGCKLEIEGHTFDIDLILFEHGSFDVIIGMDWLSRHIAEIVCQERVVRIPLPRGEVLRVYEERPEEKVKRLMSTKVEEPKMEDIAIV